MKVVTICGSMRFQKQMKEIAAQLELEQNYCVIQTVDFPSLNKDEAEKIGLIHLKKIDISDAIYVVNIDGYIGESVKREIAYAKAHGKEVIYHEGNK